MARNALTRQQEFAAGKLFEQHLKRMDGDTCSYVNGWDDTRVGKEVGYTGDQTNIARLRRDLGFGRVVGQVRPPQTTTKDLLARVEALEAIIAERETLLVELIEKHDKLVTTLALDRVANVKHLSIKNGPAAAR